MAGVKGPERNIPCGGCGKKMKNCTCSRISKILGKGGRPKESQPIAK